MEALKDSILNIEATLVTCAQPYWKKSFKPFTADVLFWKCWLLAQNEQLCCMYSMCKEVVDFSDRWTERIADAARALVVANPNGDMPEEVWSTICTFRNECGLPADCVAVWGPSHGGSWILGSNIMLHLIRACNRDETIQCFDTTYMMMDAVKRMLSEGSEREQEQERREEAWIDESSRRIQALVDEHGQWLDAMFSLHLHSISNSKFWILVGDFRGLDDMYDAISAKATSMINEQGCFVVVNVSRGNLRDQARVIKKRITKLADTPVPLTMHCLHPPAGTATGAATGTATGAATGAATGTATGTATGAATGTATGAATGAATSTATGTATGAATGAATGTATGAATGTTATTSLREMLRASSKFDGYLMQLMARPAIKAALMQYEEWLGMDITAGIGGCALAAALREFILVYSPPPRGGPSEPEAGGCSQPAGGDVRLPAVDVATPVLLQEPGRQAKQRRNKDPDLDLTLPPDGMTSVPACVQAGGQLYVTPTSTNVIAAYPAGSLLGLNLRSSVINAQLITRARRRLHDVRTKDQSELDQLYDEGAVLEKIRFNPECTVQVHPDMIPVFRVNTGLSSTPQHLAKDLFASVNDNLGPGSTLWHIAKPGKVGSKWYDVMEARDRAEADHASPSSPRPSYCSQLANNKMYRDMVTSVILEQHEIARVMLPGDIRDMRDMLAKELRSRNALHYVAGLTIDSFAIIVQFPGMRVVTRAGCCWRQTVSSATSISLAVTWMDVDDVGAYGEQLRAANRRAARCMV